MNVVRGHLTALGPSPTCAISLAVRTRDLSEVDRSHCPSMARKAPHLMASLRQP